MYMYAHVLIYVIFIEHCISLGAYTFEIYVLKVSCRCEVEFWISSSMDPMEVKRVITFEHGQPLVSAHSCVFL